MDPARAARSPIVFLSAAVLFINYVDRGTLSTASHMMQGDLHLDYLQMGLLMGAFSWTYTISQIPVGWLAERAYLLREDVSERVIIADRGQCRAVRRERNGR